MILVRRSLHAFSGRFVRFHDACIFCLALLFNATGLLVLLTSSLAKHCRWHQNFQLSARILHDILEFFIIWINEIPRNFQVFSRFGFSIVHFCLSLRFEASDLRFHISGHALLRSFVSSSVSSDYENPSGGLSFNKINVVKLVHASDNSRSSSTFQ